MNGNLIIIYKKLYLITNVAAFIDRRTYYLLATML